MNWWRYTRTPSVPERAQRAERAGKRLAKSLGKQGRAPSPVRLEGRVISRSFWGKAWCANLESYRDYEYRLPRGRSYVRSGAVLDLQIEPGRITAVVAGSRPQPYDVEIRVKPLAAAHWTRLKTQCAGEIGSLIELLEGRLSDRVMGIVTDPAQGLFPKPREIEMTCSCPDWATMCKHVAAVLYGVGARLDSEPELLFTLRNLEHGELIAAAVDLGAAPAKRQRKTIATEDLSGVFGIELADAPRAR
ncbi:MAG: SWIM zinc finger family protein, partial [Steroidobacteraceae bacterium]